jgi:hypothetical protein
MRTLAFIIITMLAVLALDPVPQAQEKTTPPKKKMECGTVVPEGTAGVELQRQARAIAATATVAAPANAPYHLPLAIHIVRRSDGTGGISLNQLSLALRDLNQVWQPAGIQFFVYGGIDYINSDTHFNVPNVRANQDALRQVNPVANTVNVYFTNLADLCGQSSFTNDMFQGILMDISCAGVASNTSSFAHEVGHYFDLFHTHETFPDSAGKPTKIECPNGSNCSTAGDLICDTPADPNLDDKVNDSCSYTGSDAIPTGCGTTPYNPAPRNLMSYSTKLCRTDITAGQSSKTLQVLRDTANRRNLIISGARYVDPLASVNNGDCSYNFPCHTIAKAIRLALQGDVIFIKPGFNQITAFPSDKRVTLAKWELGGGPALVGQ